MKKVLAAMLVLVMFALITGTALAARWVTCSQCGGSGRCKAPHCHFGTIVLELPIYEGGPTAEHRRGPCKVCNGSGKCQNCGGSGKVYR